MLGIFRSSIVNVAKPPINLFRPLQVVSRNINDVSTSKSACPECNVGNNWNTTSPSWTLTSGLKLENTRVFVQNPLFSQVAGWENLLINVGGPFNMQVRGMKYKAKAKRRCKDCYLQWINGVLFNLCNAKPRHKHQQQAPYYANQRFLTHATWSPKRPW